jgi:hypothetical protein
MVHIPYYWNISDFDRDFISKAITEYLHTFLYFTVLYCALLQNTHCIMLQCKMQHYVKRYCNLLHRQSYTIVDCTVLYVTVLHCTVLHCTVQHINVLYILYIHYSTTHNCTLIHCTLIHFTLLHNTVLRERTFELSRIADKPYTRDGDGDLHRK